MQKTQWLRYFTLTIFLMTSLTVNAASPPAQNAKISLKSFESRPKLVVVIVIDQFRADYLTRFAQRFLPSSLTSADKKGQPGGFRYLMEKGAYFPFAEYDVLQNMTCPGHSTILTGALPYAHKISLNDWYDAEKQVSVYCVDDEKFPVIGAKPGLPGASPHRLMTTTVGDELKNAGYPAKVVTIALKDRAAIMLGGHRADLALWFDSGRFQWTSSRYYLPDDKLPSWMDDLNSRISKEKSREFIWNGSGKPTGLSETSMPFELKVKVSGSKESLRTPIGVQLTTQAAIEAMKANRLGQGAATDILAVSYSSHDMMGHSFGPNSQEMEELTIVEDQNISELLRAIDKAVGLKNAVIALTADHGVAPTLKYSTLAHLEPRAVDQEELAARLNEKLNEKFGKPAKGEWILSVKSFNFYLNRSALAQKKLSLEEVSAALKSWLAKEPSAETVFTGAEAKDNRLPPGMHARQIVASYVAGVNGDVVMIPKAFHFTNENIGEHMTGYSYDRTVPLIISGTNIQAGVYPTPAHVIDLAPTLSFILGVLPPAHSDGHILSSIFSK